jgi:hypothetical protein
MPAIMEIGSPAAQATQAIVISENWAQPGGSPSPPKPVRATAPVKPERAIASAPPPPIELTDPRIKQAVAATVAEMPVRTDVQANGHDSPSGKVFSTDTPDQYQQFAKDFAHAKLPHCLGDNGLKFQPPTIGPVAFGGLLALPFVVLAKARGKCK